MAMQDNLTTEPAGTAEKIKTPFAAVIVDGPLEQPHYSVIWWDVIEQKFIVGYSSYNESYVFEWLEECFEISGVAKRPFEVTLDDLRPHGWWVGTEYDGYADGFPVYHLWECSECRGEVECEGDPPPYEFCPHCGAKMDEEGVYE